MQVQVDWQDQVAVASLSGELDTLGYEEVAPLLLEILERQPRGLILDLARVSYLASIGISLIIQMARQLGQRCGALRVANPTPRIRRVMDAANLHKLVPVDNCIEDSLESFLPE